MPGFRCDISLTGFRWVAVLTDALGAGTGSDHAGTGSLRVAGTGWLVRYALAGHSHASTYLVISQKPGALRYLHRWQQRQRPQRTARALIIGIVHRWRSLHPPGAARLEPPTAGHPHNRGSEPHANVHSLISA